MATYHLDYVNGNDGNDGSSWGNAWKTLTTGATAARIAPGDIIKIAKSPAPVNMGINATWTNNTKTITLSAAVAADIDLCESTWTASTNVSCGVSSTTKKQGTNSAYTSIATAFSTGKAAYKATGTLDLSSYQGICLWINPSTSINDGVSSLKICLCSDVAGATPVDTFYLPTITSPKVGRWSAIHLNKGSALGSSIKSIALYADTDPGTPTIYFDAIIAVKATSAANFLTYNHLVSKSTVEQGGTENWYSIESITAGTTVTLDLFSGTNSSTYVTNVYFGPNETVALYSRTTIVTDFPATQTTKVQEITDSGTAGSLIEYQGGYNTSNGNQDGETIFDGGRIGWGYGIYAEGKSFIKLNHISCIRYYNGFHLLSFGSSRCENILLANNCYNIGFNLGIYNHTFGYNLNSYVNVQNAIANASSGVTVTALANSEVIVGTAGSNPTTSNAYAYAVSINGASNSKFTLGYLRGNYPTSATPSFYNGLNVQGCIDCDIEVSACKYNNIGVSVNGLMIRTRIRNCTMSDNSTSSVMCNGGSVGDFAFVNCLMSDTVEVSYFPVSPEYRICSQDHDQTAGNHWQWTFGGTINSQTTKRHTASGIAWKMSPTDALRSVDFPLFLHLGRLWVNANAQVTARCFFLRDNTGITGALAVRGGMIAGVTNTVKDTMTADADTWEQLEITFTPTEAGLVTLEAWAYGGTTYSVYVDDLYVAQA